MKCILFMLRMSTLNYVKAEKSRSLTQIEKFFDNKIKLDVNYFNLEYSDVLEVEIRQLWIKLYYQICLEQ